MVDRPGRSRGAGIAVRRHSHAPPRPPALHPQAGESAVGSQRLSARPEVALRVRLLPLHVGLRKYLAHHWACDGAESAISGGRWSSGSIWTGSTTLASATIAATFVPCAGAHRRGPQDVEEAPQVRRRGPCARRRRPEVQPGARRVRLHAVPVGQLRRVARRESGAGAGRPRAWLSRTALLELAREMRQASAARGLGSLGLVGGA